MWIEQLFADLEDGGFHLNRSRIYPPERLSRLAGGTFADVRLAFASALGWSSGGFGRRSTELIAEIEATQSPGGAGFSGV